jgi:TolB protein
VRRVAPCDDGVVAPTVLIVDDHAEFRAFARTLLEAEGFEVVGEAPDGASAVAAASALRPEVVLQGMPTYSPDGKRIAFDRTLPHEDSIWTMKTDGTDLRQVTHNKPAGKRECRCDGSPSFSPDGRQIAFVRTINESKVALFTIRTSGRGLKQLTPWSRGVAAKVDWSPDGSLIVLSSPNFEPGPKGVSSNVYTIHPDGTGLTQLTHDTGGKVHNGADSFSPDGTKIVYVNNSTGAYQLYVMNVDGTGVARVTNATDAHWANWGPSAG